ncbi:hypothetical protein FOZ62_004017 [Perkinsus olseni]|uniref:CCHC-type domain-containing protein n=1 Tax=Perkinsus olseni TaxID=32597 RepID=A0A7J6PWE6_PEROL|nr:hypothetical protein FOZ62_004017 [Perkinsus olseni]
MSALKFEQVLKRFHGNSSEESWEQWAKKFSLVASLQNWSDADQVKYLPLFLEGQAWDVYSQLTPRSTSTKEALFSAMASAFDPSPSEAWKAFQGRKYQQGESVDGYLADLRRLLILSGTQPESAPSVLSEKFCAGLPETVSAQVRLSAAPEGSLDLTTCLLRARVLLHSPQGAMRTSRTADDKRQSRDGKGSTHRRRIICFNCGQPGHVRRDCPRKKNGTTTNTAPTVADSDYYGQVQSGRDRPGSGGTASRAPASGAQESSVSGNEAGLPSTTGFGSPL